MVAAALSGFLSNDGNLPEGTIVTAVFPGGCQLNCGFCIVGHRGERNSGFAGTPTPQFYHKALSLYAESGTLAGAGIIGDEPLQESVWPYTSGFLRICNRARRPSTLVTNGLELAGFARRLEQFDLTQVVVSLDGIGRSHDRIRGKLGAFDQIAHGLRSVSRETSLFQRLSISTILRAGHLDDAKGVLDFIASLGYTKWLVSPLLDPRPGKPIRVNAKLRPQIADMLRTLGPLATSKGVTMIATDEFGLLDEVALIAQEVGFPVKRPRTKPSLIRLDAYGRCWTWDQLISGTPQRGAMRPIPLAERRTEALSTAT